MAWISLLLFTAFLQAAELPKLLTKHAPETLRYLSMDGRYFYVQKRPGVLGLVSSFRSNDFLSDASFSDFIVTGSRFKRRLAIEIVPLAHTEFSLVKNHKIMVVSWGNTNAKEVGTGKAAKLHLNDEWITYFNALTKTLHVQNLVTDKKYDISLSTKANPFFVPEVEMVTEDTVVYSDINESGFVALISYNLKTQKNNIIYKAPQTGTHIELCQNKGYLAIGEFPYEGVTRGSKILKININGQTNLSGFSTIYDAVAQDIGNMICMKDSIFFIKTTGQNKELTTKTSEVAKLILKNEKIELKSEMGNVGQLVEMDERVLIPLRGEFYVVEGISNLGTDTLKAVPGQEEELSL
jgi:hypothetical protein